LLLLPTRARLLRSPLCAAPVQCGIDAVLCVRDGSCEALALLEHVLLADDTRHMMNGLKAAGLKLELDEAARSVTIDAPASTDFGKTDAEIFCGNSGTTIRFLAALLAAAGDARFVLTGEPRMLERPIGPLVDLLRTLAGSSGTTLAFEGRDGFPPLQIEARGLQGAVAEYPAARVLSSQYLSAACMVAPVTQLETHLRLGGRQLSWPYVVMTMRLMDVFGVTPELERHEDTGEPEAIVVPRGRFDATTYDVEPDASAASYFLALAAIHPGAKLTVEGLGKHSLQGDAGFADVLAKMGAEVEQTETATTVTGPPQLDGIDIDMADLPDCVQTLAVASLFAVGETTMHGLRTLRVKETDRIAALQAELTKLGAVVALNGDGEDETMTITPPLRPRGASIATYDDHRMAMSFALASTKIEGVHIEDPSCVSKTYPEFFEDLAGVTS
ncbi:MAG: 3-phosphoshikimate 1-carboxyvinyltransferase, partial [Planctomycetota bacterium]